MKPRFTDEQIIQMLKEQAAGERTAEVCRRYAISQGTFYKYKSKFGGMEPSDARRLRVLEDENARLKKLVAEQMLDITMLREVNAKKWWRPARSNRLWCISARPTVSASAGPVPP